MKQYLATKKMRVGRVIRNIFLTLMWIIIALFIIVSSYVLYVVLSYKRIGDVDLDITNNAIYGNVQKNEVLTLTSYNIGFGAYSQDYTFFMDEGYDSSGNKTVGKSGKAKSKEDVIKNTNGSIDVIKKLNSDFVLLQEVDSKSSRSYKVNQREEFESALSLYDSTYCVNYDSAYLFYPLYDPHGKSLAGLSTFSKYKINEAERKEYTISTSFSKFFDLDRCFSVQRISVENDKELVLINSHMSAYDEGGTIRNKQLHELNTYMKEEANKGNYVIVGGDFNHDLITNNPMYNYTMDNFAYKSMIKQKKPDWLNYMFDSNKKSNFDSLFTIYASDNEPSCRDCDVVFTRGDTFVSTVDGFITSNNVEVSSVFTTKTGNDDGFEFSDHQPTTLTFKLL